MHYTQIVATMLTIQKVKYVIPILFLSIILYIYVVPTENRAVFLSPPNTDYALSIINSAKRVLLVNPPQWFTELKRGKLRFIDAGCEVSNCILTSNHSYVKDYKFDAFIVYAPNRIPSLWTLSNRTRDQIFILFSLEPPDHMPKWKDFENYFNWTMTYLPESEMHLPYGRIEPLFEAPIVESERIKIQEKHNLSNINPAFGKTKLAVWTVSNCNARSNRLQYVQELQKYIDIDIFSESTCGKKNVCKKKEKYECLETIEQTYKFYLAFENSICREYVTEKLYNSIGRNIVPIVLGGANYSAIAPRDSYINALDYTPRQLAEYLQKLDKDDSLYAQYFWWKPYYRVLNQDKMTDESFCKLCAALHANPMQEKTATPEHLNKWYFEESHCIDRPDFSTEKSVLIS